MKTVRYYTKGRYMGWEQFHAKKVQTYVSWIRSGNDLKIEDTLINDVGYIRQLCRGVKL